MCPKWIIDQNPAETVLRSISFLHLQQDRRMLHDNQPKRPQTRCQRQKELKTNSSYVVCVCVQECAVPLLVKTGQNTLNAPLVQLIVAEL